MAKVIHPVQDQGDTALAVKLKMALAGGPLVAQAALEAKTRLLARQGCTLLDLHIGLHLKCQQAMEMSLDSAPQRRLFIKLHADLLYRERQLHLQERQLVHRCQQALRKHELAQANLELRRQRAAARAAEGSRARTRTTAAPPARGRRHSRRQPRSSGLAVPPFLRQRRSGVARQPDAPASNSNRQGTGSGWRRALGVSRWPPPWTWLATPNQPQGRPWRRHNSPRPRPSRPPSALCVHGDGVFG